MYSITKDGNIVGDGLSRGELNQWLIELDKVLPEHQQELFRKDLGVCKQVSDADFENFVYDNNLELPIITTHAGKDLVITQTEY